MKKDLVAVAMSGGVDSSVAACLLKEQGYDLIGLTMCFNLAERGAARPSCCGLSGIEDARLSAAKLGIKHYVLNLEKDFSRQVVRDFCSQYLNGRTPNPCVLCNQHIKFGILLKKVISLGAKFLASGHYARIARGSRGYLLKKSACHRKDQSYFLYRLNQEQLKRIIFPLGNYTKEQVRKVARKFSLPVAQKPESQEICFIPGCDYRDFLASHAAGKIRPGQIRDKQGNLLGRHKGIAFYTIGQRQGLGVAKGYPVYVTGIDKVNNRIIAGKKEEAYKRSFLVKEPSFVQGPLKKKVELKVRIRYNHKESSALLEPLGGSIKVTFNQPQFAITPGQSAVFYLKDTVLGGGIIDEVLG